MGEQKPFLCVTGSHADVRNDIAAITKVGAWDYMAIGLDAVDKYLWPILYVATFHPQMISAVRERRRSVGGNIDYKVISHERHPGVDILVTDWWRPSGSSALLGAQAAICLGYRKIVLCGCPLTGKNSKGSSYETFRKGWEKNQARVKSYVRSMSGWTKDLLGEPTDLWLMGGQ